MHPAHRTLTLIHTKKQLIYHQLPFLCDPGEARTLDPLIKSQLLYQLSYGVIIMLQTQFLLELRCKVSHFF